MDNDGRLRRRSAARARRRRRRLAAVGVIVAAALAAGLVLAASRPGRRTPAPGVAATPTTAPKAPSPATVRQGPVEPPGRRVPILMYHATEAAPPGSRYPGLWVSKPRLEAEMAMLRRRGFHAVTMRALAAYWQRRGTLPRKPIVLTFDDGYRSDATNAMPVLRHYGSPGVLYLQAGALKTPGPQGMSRAEVRSVLRNGWELGSHTIDHSDLSTLGQTQLRYEVAYSRRYFERMFGVPIESFCYPAGKFNAAAVASVARAGYATATTVQEGLADRRQRLTLRRIRVDATDTAQTLALKLAPAGA